MDRQEDRIAISILRISVLTCDKNDNSLRLETQTNVHATTTTLSCHHDVARRRATTTRHGVVPPRRRRNDDTVVTASSWCDDSEMDTIQRTHCSKLGKDLLRLLVSFFLHDFVQLQHHHKTSPAAVAVDCHQDCSCQS